MYLDSPLTIEHRDKEKIDSQELEREDPKQRELMELVAKANQEAERIVLEASQRAQEMLLQAQQEYNTIINQANAAAEEILRNAQLQAESYRKQLSETIVRITESFEKALHQMLQLYSTKITAVLKVLVEKFLEKDVDEEVTNRKLQKVLTHLVSATKVKLRINPKDMQLVPPETLTTIKSRGYEIVADPSVSHGVIAETELGTIDTTLGFQLTMLDEIFEELGE